MNRCCHSDISPVEQGVHRFFCCMMPAATSGGRNVPGAKPGPANDQGVERIVSSLDTLRSKVNGSELDLLFLRDLFESSDFQSLLKVHHKVTTPEAQENAAMLRNSLDTLKEVYEMIDSSACSGEAKELHQLLSTSHFRGVMYAHDQIALKDFLPSLPDIPHEVDEDEESVKVVRLVKGTTEPLGATIKRNDQTGTIHIARVLHGGAADRSGLIQVGDQVHEVNGIQVHGKEPNEIVQLLNDTVGPITLKLGPGEDLDYGLYRECKMRVRAHFSYDPENDKIIPCKEAGLSFKRGDILHIVNQDDPNWWQARREGDRNMRAGLIPGKQLQERKMAAQIPAKDSVESSPKKSPKIDKMSKAAAKFSPKLSKKSKKTRKIMYHAYQEQDYDSEEIVTYEEVERYYPKIGRYRPIVLIGPPGVGRNELKRRLLATNPNQFKSTIPHTSRPKKATEVEGEEYYFMSRQDMDKDIQSKRFVEFGEYKGNLYGTSLEAIKCVVNAGHVCVLCPHPQAMKLLRTTELKPYIIFIKPPSLDKLKETRNTANAKSTFDEKNSRPFTEEEFEDMLHSATRLETIYRHCFDQIIVNEDLQKAANELCLAAHKIETEPQWVPAAWVR